MGCYIGIDVGGTTTTVALGDERGNVLDISEQFPTQGANGPATTIQAIVTNVAAGLERVGAAPDHIQQVCLATPGPATLDGVVLKTPNLGASWDRFPIRAELEAAMQSVRRGVHVGYIGDGQAAALGEYSVRTGRVVWSELQDVGDPQRLESLFLLTVGTGLGGGEVRDGKVVRGAAGRAGHGGHLLLPHYAFRYDHDRQLRVGNALCTAESAVSLSGLTHQLSYRLTLPQWRGHPLNQTDEPIREKAKRLRELASEGDALAVELFEDQARALGVSLLNVNYVGDYDLLVIGGGVSDLKPSLRDHYRQVAEDAYMEYALDGFRTGVHIEFSVCRDNAAVIGALAYAYVQAED